MIELSVPDDALAVLRPLFTGVEGSCESWSDEEVVRRMLIRGAMEYAKSAGQPWEGVQSTAAALREALS
ncbi:MAG TPA: hypothetical protein VM287_15325 [Egibacteraceae bacterium]|nr:hypothetical protein [Egibacteraceae bacterium]